MISTLGAALQGRYTIEREVGRGGMATVYLARDVRHNRNVALKVLNPELGAVLGVERFLAEIEVTANLQHPNLLPLFDSGAVDGLLFYVMPFVEGESLRARLDREKQLPVDEAVRIATATASALQYAHEHGVIHRDLKPENLLLQAGQPVIADFGIALAVSKAGGTRVTQTGLSLGTPQYMSPEQATGDRTIDARSDIYSLGAMTYEMLVGDPPHLGGTSQAIIAKVLTERPSSVRVSRPSVPDHVAWAVERALEKLPADRWASAREFAEALAGARFTARVDTTGRAVMAPAARRRSVATVAAVGVAGITLGALAVSLLKQPPAERLSRFVLALPDTAPLYSTSVGARVAISRDGSQLVYLAGRRAEEPVLYLRSLNDPLPRLLTGTEGASAPAFSPDGEWIAFLQRGQIRKLNLAGGSPIKVAESGSRPHWGDGGHLVFSRNRGIYRISENGTGEAVIAEPDTTGEQRAFLSPFLLPGGKHVVFSIVKSTAAELGVADIASGEVVGLGIEGSAPQYDGRGNLLFVRADGTLHAMPFSLRTRRPTGAATLIMQQVVVSVAPGSPADYAVADDGTLTYVHGMTRLRELVAVSRDGAERRLSDDVLPYGWPRLSHDGRRLALEIQEPMGAARWDVWVYDIAPRTLTRLTTSSGVRPAGWTDDDRQVVYVGSDSGMRALRTLRAQQWDGGQPSQLALRYDPGVFEATVGPVGTYFAVVIPASGGDIGIAPRDSPEKLTPFVATGATENQPRLSPDGKFLAYRSNETGAFEVYVRPVPGPGSRLQVSAGGGAEPVWSRDGKELFYRAPNHLVSARLSLGTELAVMQRDTLFQDTYARGSTYYDVFPGGKEFVMIREQSSGAQLQVILNWHRILDRK